MTACTWLVLKVPLPPGEWTAIVAPLRCNCFALKSASGAALEVGSSPDDPAQQDTLPANAQEVLLAPFTPPAAGTWKATRFAAGDTILYAMSPGGDTAILRLVL
jgi:hypothetical protein